MIPIKYLSIHIFHFWGEIRSNLKDKRTYEKYLKSPLARGISLWDRLSEEVQKSTTKFKFKRCIQRMMI